MTSDSQNRTLPLSGDALPATQATVISSYSVPAVDLNHEALLKPAPRIVFNQLTVPALGGIPLLAKLGQGGMGAVFFGVHTRLMLEVAVKVLPFQLADQDPTLIQRFFREAQIAAKVKSPHLVSVMDVNEESGLFYLVMEFVHGRTAGEYCRETVKKEQLSGLDEDVALDICIAATEGLIAAHSAGIIHRDIKPENILIPREKGTGQYLFKNAKLADLGLARNDQTVQSLTAAQNVMGTPGYMSPEQANDAKNANKPADIFSMGATLYALLCGQAPFTGSTTLEAVLNTIQKTHRPVTHHRPDVSLEVSTLIDRCLSKRPERRFEDAVALQQALNDCRSLLTNRVTRPVRARGATVLRPGPADDETLDPQPRSQNPYTAAAKFQAKEDSIRPPAPPRRKSSLVFLLCGAALLVAGGLWLARQNQLADEARKAEELRAADDAKAAAEKARLAKVALAHEQQAAAQRAKDAELEAMRQKALREAAEAQARKNAPPAGSNGTTVSVSIKDAARGADTPATGDVQSAKRKATAAQLSGKIQRLQRALKSATDDAQKAISEQNHWADQVNALGAKRHQLAESMNKLRKQIQDAHNTLGPPREMPRGQGRPGGPNGPDDDNGPDGQASNGPGGPGGSGGPGGRMGRRPPPPPPPRDDNDSANSDLEEQMHKWEQDEMRMQEQAVGLDRDYNEAFRQYNTASTAAMDKLNARTRLETELNGLLKSPTYDP